MARRLRLVVIAFVAAFVAVAAQALTFPPLTGRVVDQANILTAEVRQRLDAKLADLEAKTGGTQLVVATLRSLEGTDIADYGYQLGRAWGIGQKGKNNGALLIVAPNERKVRIEVGYGLEGDLTDAVTRLIIDNAIVPRFKANDAPGGIERGVQDIVSVLTGDSEDFKQRAAEQARARAAPEDSIGPFLLVVIFVILWLVVTSIRRRNGRWVVVPSGGGGWSTGSSSGGGGWSSGSSGGGFSGGGGSFGGGGSSGSW